MPSRRAFLAGMGATAAGATAGCSSGPADPSYVGSDPETEWWPQSKFDRYGSCYNPRAAGPTGSVGERWRVEVPMPSARPVVAGGTAFFPTMGGLVAVDAASGEKQWREPTDGDGNGWDAVVEDRKGAWSLHEVVYHDGAVYVAAVDSPGLLAFDAGSGERLWTFDPPDPAYGCRALTVGADSSALFAGTDDAVYALDAASGDVLWRRDVFGRVSALASGWNGLLAATDGGEVYALNDADGRGYWRRNLAGGPPDAFGVGASGRRVYVGLFGGPIHALDGGTGATEWTADVTPTESFVVTGETLYTANMARFSALDTGDGSVRWSEDPSEQCGPAAAGDTVYVAAGDSVTAFALGGGRRVAGLRFGARRWSQAVGGVPVRGLAVANGAVFVPVGRGDDGPSRAIAIESA